MNSIDRIESAIIRELKGLQLQLEQEQDATEKAKLLHEYAVLEGILNCLPAPDDSSKTGE